MQPDWLVMRPGDIAQISNTHPPLLPTEYQVAAHADVRERIAKYTFLPGRDYVAFDAVDVVYRRVTPKKAQATSGLRITTA